MKSLLATSSTTLGFLMLGEQDLLFWIKDKGGVGFPWLQLGGVDDGSSEVTEGLPFVHTSVDMKVSL